MRSIKILALAFACIVASWVGNQIARGQGGSGYRCLNWQCSGTLQGCTLNPSYYVYGCFLETSYTCNLSGWFGLCPGTNQWGQDCTRSFYDCNNPS
jgi:hypothetical protein